MDLQLSLAQMNLSLGTVDANLQTAARFARDAASAGSHFLLLPELWSSGYDLANAARYTRANQHVLEEVRGLALEYRISIGGSLLLEGPGGTYNSFVIIGPDGQESARYNKLHLFRLMQEEQFLQPGANPQTAQTAFGLAGMAVCYDLRFPELFRRYALDGAQVILLPAEWPARRIDHWNTLLRARAIENQFFVAGVNVTGKIGGDIYGGCSAVISPWGETLAVAGSEEGLIHARINLEQVNAVRARIPVFTDRRPEVYGTDD